MVRAMATTGPAQDVLWPPPTFRFLASFGSQANIPFQAVSGLETETPAAGYRPRKSPLPAPVKQPKLAKIGNVTLKRGVFPRTEAFRTWYASIAKNKVARANVVLQLVNEQGKPTMSWTLSNAWPAKITGADLDSDGNEVAVEALELAHEGITSSSGG